MDLEELARKYALKNAVEYEGECNPGAVIGQIMSEEDADPQEVQKVAGKVCGEVNAMSLEEQKEAIEQYEFEEEEHEHDPIPDLQDAEEGEVVVRFAPNPNGPPHLGHSRGMVINGELRDKYDGKLILRYDDTDPRKKRPMTAAYEMYEEDYTWLGYKPDEVRYSSKNFDTYIEYAEKLIEMEKAYVCKCSQEEGHEYREKGEPCPHRDQSAERNRKLWEQMKDGGIEDEDSSEESSRRKSSQEKISEGEATLKIRTEMDHKNPAVRDFVAWRIIDNPDHPVTGDEYRVWPLLDFAGAIEDHVMGTTHIVRGKDLRASTKRQKYIYDYLGWEYPNIRYWGRVKIEGLETTMSSSSLKEMVDSGELEGWDDPRAPTLRAFRRRGFRPEAIQNFWVEMGVNEKDNNVSLETLESHNREIVEEEADRYFFVREPIELEIEGLPKDVEPEMQLHPDDPERGVRKPELERNDGKTTVFVEESDLKDGFLRLKGLCNVEVEDGTARYVEGDHKVAMEKDADIIHWVPGSAENGTVLMPDGSSFKGRIEPNSVDEGDVVQFERFGFARCDDAGEQVFCYTHS